MAQVQYGGGLSQAEQAFAAFDEARSAETQSRFRQLSDDEIKGIVGNEISDAIGATTSGSEIAEARRQALRMFFGKPFGNEQKGRSQVVMTEVADTLHWILPSLMRMFTGGATVVEFEPRAKPGMTPEERVAAEEAADQATEVINKLFMDDCNGFEVLYEWFFTALLERRGFVKVYQDERVEPKIETYIGLTEREFESLMNDGRNLQVMQYDERTEQFQGEEVPVVDVTVKQVEVVSQIKIEGIAPEEFLIAKRDHKLHTNDTWFCGERRRLYSSDLIAMGFPEDFVMDLPANDEHELSIARIARREDENDWPGNGTARRDTASREHWVNDCYIRMDADGDGYSELRNIMVVGDNANVLLSNEYANFIPYASLTAWPVPFKFHGLGLGDIVGDLQKIKSTLWRQMLDNIYLQNNQRHVILEGAVEVNDMLVSRPGGLIRASTLDAVKPLETTPLQPLTMSLLNELDNVREVRTGVSPNHSGIDAASLKGGATGVAAHTAAALARVELIGRIFAETGVKDLFSLIYRTFKQNNNKPMTIRLRGKWVDVNPSQWQDDIDVKVKVGLGVGAAAERISYLMGMIQLQQTALQMGAGGFVTPKHVYNALSEMTRTMGFSKEDMFFGKPQPDQGWPEPQPDPKILEHERRVRDDEMKARVEMLTAQSEALEREKMTEWRFADLTLKDQMNQRDAETRIKVAEITVEAQKEMARDRPNTSESG